MSSNNSISCKAASFLPATAVLEMTYRCNHKCIFCSCPWYSKSHSFDARDELSTQQWKDLISKLADMGVVNFAFTGGESLLKEDLLEITHHAGACEVEHIETIDGKLERRKGRPNLYLLSNGKIMSDDVLDVFKQYAINLSL